MIFYLIHYNLSYLINLNLPVNRYSLIWFNDYNSLFLITLRLRDFQEIYHKPGTGLPGILPFATLRALGWWGYLTFQRNLCDDDRSKIGDIANSTSSSKSLWVREISSRVFINNIERIKSTSCSCCPSRRQEQFRHTNILVAQD